MYQKRDLTTTSISISNGLLDEAKNRATLSFRTFSQYVSFLIHEDLHRAKSEKLVSVESAKDQVAA